jgi:hypothetical protein
VPSYTDEAPDEDTKNNQPQTNNEFHIVHKVRSLFIPSLLESLQRRDAALTCIESLEMLSQQPDGQITPALLIPQGQSRLFSLLHLVLEDEGLEVFFL